jgi:hypothetical protein
MVVRTVPIFRPVLRLLVDDQMGRQRKDKGTGSLSIPFWQASQSGRTTPLRNEKMPCLPGCSTREKAPRLVCPCSTTNRLGYILGAEMAKQRSPQVRILAREGRGAKREAK